MLSDKLLRDMRGKGVTVSLASEIERPEMVRTGWPSLDHAIGGIPTGRISYIWGPRGVGKTTLCYCIAARYLRRGSVLYIDAERSFDKSWAFNFIQERRFDDRFFVVEPARGGGEGIVDAMIAALKSDAPPALIVIDSISSVTGSKVLNRDMDKALMGLDAAFNNRMVRVLNVVNDKTAIVIVGQHREGLGKWDYIPGGNGIQHLASLIVKMRGSPLRAKDSDLSDDDPGQQVGVLSRWMIQKNKLGKSYQQGYEVIYTEGLIDTFDSELRIALEKGLVVKAGAWYTLPGGLKVQGSTKVRLWVEGNEDEWSELIYGEQNGTVL